MVRPDRAGEADIPIGFHDLHHIQRTVIGFMRGFVENAGFVNLDVADMAEMQAALLAKMPDDRWDVIFRAGPQRAAAKSQAVAGAVDQIDNALQIFFRSRDARQSEHGPGRIVGWIAILMPHSSATGIIARKK